MLVPIENVKSSLESRAWEGDTLTQMISCCVRLSSHLSGSLILSPYFKKLSKLVKLTEQIFPRTLFTTSRSFSLMRTDGRTFCVA